MFEPFNGESKRGGSTLKTKTIIINGNYNASDDDADGYSTVHVNVPNSYVAEDEGKVVVSGELIAQTSSVTTINGVIDTTAINSLEVDVPRTGYQHGGVNFFDVDGTVLYAYTPEEFSRLEEMPPNPDRSWEYLEAKGWNWTLADAKVYVAAHGALNIGQYYEAPDGKTAIKVVLDEGCLHPQLGLYVNGSVDIDWGDETAHSTITGNGTGTYRYTDHTYAEPGLYYILLTITGMAIIKGKQKFFCKGGLGNTDPGNESKKYSNSIYDIHLGENIDIGAYAFYRCYSLEHIAIPPSITTIGNGTFQYCTSLEAITIPNGVTTLGDNTFEGCYGLRFVSAPKTITSAGTKCFSQCYSVIALTFPEGFTTVGSYCFADTPSCDILNAPGLTGTIPQEFIARNRTMMAISIPEGITSIGANAFDFCYGLKDISLPSTLRSVGANAFSNCAVLDEIEFPNAFETFGINTFYNNTALQKFTIPASTTAIPVSMFEKCNSLSAITIPSGITDIGAKAFSECYGLAYIKFESSTPPVVANSNAWNNLSTDCIIYVPTGKLADYTSAQNYPDSNTYTYIEY